MLLSFSPFDWWAVTLPTIFKKLNQGLIPISTMDNRKVKALIIIMASLGALALSLLVFLGTHDRQSMTPLKAATVIAYDETLTDGMNISGCASECFYSTKADKRVQDDLKILETETGCLKYFNKYWDIQQTYPEHWGESIYKGRYADDCVAVVISAMELQNPNTYVMANGLYIDDNNHAVIELIQTDRNSDFQYTCDPATNCKQLYTVIYLPKKLIGSLTSLTFATNSNT